MAAMNYANDYLDRLLRMESVVESHVEKNINRIVEQKFRQFIDDQHDEKRPRPAEK